jgi:hypothetical protein
MHASFCDDIFSTDRAEKKRTFCPFYHGPFGFFSPGPPPFTSNQVLNLEGNQLHRLPPGMGLLHLRELRCSHNRLEGIGPDLLVPNLQHSIEARGAARALFFSFSFSFSFSKARTVLKAWESAQLDRNLCL